jgi:hypothetical protein
MKRADVLAALRVAGYHNDQRSRVRLIVENRVSREAADTAWVTGQYQKHQGVACACHTCKEAFHAHIRAMERLHNAGCTVDTTTNGTNRWLVAGHTVGTTTGPIGATTGYAICPTPPQ